MDKKLFLRPIFCTFSAFLSSALFSVGIAGTGGLFKGGLGAFSAVGGRLFSCIVRSLGFGTFLLRPLLIVLDLVVPAPSSSPLDRFSISPRTVLPFVPRNSSPTPTNLTTPRSADTPSESVIKAWTRAVLRLLVTGWICEGSAVIVRM